MANNDNYIYVCQDEDGDIALASKNEVEKGIDSYEEADVELGFEVIAKIKKLHLRMDIDYTQIEWYKPDDLTKPLIDKVILAVVAYLT